MDLLYSRYASPFEFIRLYVEQGRFGELVTEILHAEQKRKEEAAEKEKEDRLWSAYVHSYSDKSFNDWQSEVLSNATQRQSIGKRDEDLTNKEVDAIIRKLFHKG